MAKSKNCVGSTKNRQPAVGTEKTPLDYFHIVQRVQTVLLHDWLYFALMAAKRDIAN
jgi:hypothetical protein